MTAPKPSIEDLFRRWKERQQAALEKKQSIFYRVCEWPGCVVMIDMRRSRRYCFWHGGEPDD